jgi:hypothetical protein
VNYNFDKTSEDSFVKVISAKEVFVFFSKVEKRNQRQTQQLKK